MTYTIEETGRYPPKGNIVYTWQSYHVLRVNIIYLFILFFILRQMGKNEVVLWKALHQEGGKLSNFHVSDTWLVSV